MIAIIDYGVGNLGSVLNAFKYLGYDAFVTSNKEEILKSLEKDLSSTEQEINNLTDEKSKDCLYGYSRLCCWRA